MFMCFSNLLVSSLRAFMKDVMDTISSKTVCSFHVLSTENSPDLWEKWHEKRNVSLVLEGGKVVKDSHLCLSFHSNSCEMLERCSSISCVAPGWRPEGLLCVTLHFLTFN